MQKTSTSGQINNPRPGGPVTVSHGDIPDGMEFEELFTHQHARGQNGVFHIPALAPGAQVWIAQNI
ncbi:MAG: hypothetical protein A2Z71_03945 [Chloroflexi bacterium RBG_13_50_21]|nr:MAG: hypothetical protein A2Z71_03945 [Chloroflexi bacterium RBG_13_50_21]